MNLLLKLIGGARSAEAPATEPAATPRTQRADAPRAFGFLDGWMATRSPQGLLVLGWIADGAGRQLDATLLREGNEIPAAWAERYSRPDVAADQGLAQSPDLFGCVLFFELPHAPELLGKAQVRIASGEDAVAFDLDLTALQSPNAAMALAAAWKERYDELLERFGNLPAEVLMAVSLGDSGDESEMRLTVDHGLELGEGTYFLDGWLLPPEGQSVSIHLVEERQRWATLLDPAMTVRQDVVDAYKHSRVVPQRCGFAAFATLPASEEPAALAPALALYLRSDDGAVTRCAVELPRARARRAALQTVLGAFASSQADLGHAVSQHMGPAIETILSEQEKGGVPSPYLRWYGQAPAKPKATVIIPLWRRVDLVRYQLAVFNTVPAPSSWELIFALDDPSFDEQSVRKLTEDWLDRYQMPFGVMTCGANLGFLRTLNLAAGLARGDTIAFMHSDVFPDQTDWVERALRAFQRSPECGILGPKLLYEDGTVQGEGMRLKSVNGLLEPVDAGRGQPDVAEATEPVVVDGVSSACMFVRRSLFERLGGFDLGYLLEDEFAELDLCLRARELGATSLVDPGIVMRHLEGQSYTAFIASEPLLWDPGWRRKVRTFNSWRLGTRAGTAAP